MNTSIEISKKDWAIYTHIERPINMVRKYTNSMLSYKINIFANISTNDQIIVIQENREILAPTLWDDDDIRLFRFYLDDEYQHFPIYAEYSTDPKDYILVSK